MMMGSIHTGTYMTTTYVGLKKEDLLFPKLEIGSEHTLLSTDGGVSADHRS